MLPKPTIYPEEQFSQAVAQRVISALQKGITECDQAVWVVAGGSTFTAVYSLLASEQYCNQVEWQKVHILFGDERCVPPTNPDSNFAAFTQAFTRKDPVIHRILAELSLQETIADYEQVLAHNKQPFDVVLLGIGSDGHTASIFPSLLPDMQSHQYQIAECAKPDLPPFVPRITLGFAALANSRQVLVCAAGKSKTPIIRALANDTQGIYPASHIYCQNGSVELLIDTQAATM